MATATKKKASTQVKLQPLGDRLVVRREESEDRTEGGIYLPDSAKGKPTRGTIVSVGDGRLLDDGSRGPMQVKVGDEEFVLMGESEVLAVLE
jgi:chaperonin GroES